MPTSTPGTTPPRNSPPIETLPVAPYTTAMMLGGIRLAMVEAEAISAAVKAEIIAFALHFRRQRARQDGDVGGR